MSGATTPAAITGRVVLVLLAALAASAWVFTPVLIHPYPEAVRWFESPGMFPRVALALVTIGGALEFWRRWRDRDAPADGDELDASESSVRLAVFALVGFAVYSLLTPVVGYWIATALFVCFVAWLARLPMRYCLGLAIGISLALWVVFPVLLKVSFGRPLWLDWVGG